MITIIIIIIVIIIQNTSSLKKTPHHDIIATLSQELTCSHRHSPPPSPPTAPHTRPARPGSSIPYVSTGQRVGAGSSIACERRSKYVGV
eukprot:3846116-Rhodomonas_salina.1